MGKFKNSRQLVKETIAVLKQDKEIMWFPIISEMLTILLAISFIIPLSLTETTNDILGFDILF